METIILLKVLALNYPILQHWGISFSKCITVVVAEDKTVEVKELLKNFHSPFGKIKFSRN